nr:hypothetical protein CFP56_59505 [Quercus suber]
MISGPPSSICSDQDLIPFPYFTFSTKVSFLPSPQKNSDFLSFCSNSLSPEMVHAFKAELGGIFCFNGILGTRKKQGLGLVLIELKCN